MIGAMLNIANGTPAGPDAGDDDANNLLGDSQLPMRVDPSSALGQQMMGDAYMLDSYNNNNATTAAADDQ